MIQLRVIGTQLTQLNKAIDREEQALRKAQLNAVKTEGFSLRMTLMQAIRMSTPAPGSTLKELSIIARTLNRKSGIRQHRPLLRLAGGVTYQVNEASGEMRVGFTQRSPFWVRRAAERQQAGFTIPVTDKMRHYFAARGAERREKRTWKGRRLGNPLMLRYSTRRLIVPPRPIIAPFWESEKNKSEVRIRRNFRLISRGRTAPGGVLYSPQEMAGW